jgi:hypothetical protein
MHKKPVRQDGKQAAAVGGGVAGAAVGAVAGAGGVVAGGGVAMGGCTVAGGGAVEAGAGLCPNAWLLMTRLATMTGGNVRLRLMNLLTIRSF